MVSPHGGNGARVGSRDPLSVLLVEDNPGDARLVQEALRSYSAADFRVERRASLSDAAGFIDDQVPDAIVLDLSLPDSEGLETLKTIRESAPGTPIVVVTGDVDRQRGVDSIQCGAQDHLVKSHPDLGSVLGRSLHFAVERGRLESEVHYLAKFDTVTGLPNRNLFLDRASQALSISRRQRRGVGLLFLDLDHFKSVNDALGHAAGDMLLTAVGERLTGCVRESDTVARLGGDEFVVLLTALDGAADAEQVARKIADALSEPFQVEGQQVFAAASIGISLYPEDGNDIETLLRNADAAMYRGKQDGRRQYRFYSSSMNAEALQQLILANELRHALDKGEFRLHFQPMVDLTSGEIRAHEALLRWQHPDLGMIQPNQILPMAEDTGILPMLEQWVVEQCIARLATLAFSPRIAVNLSLRSKSGRDLLRGILDRLDHAGVRPGALELEISEKAIIDCFDDLGSSLQTLRDAGVRIAIDDFGAGQSSLSYLQQLPVDTLKIDRSFVRNLPEDPDSNTIVRAVIGLAHNLDLTVVAEGVEHEDQATFLREHGCDLAQGFHFGRPESRSPEPLRSSTGEAG